MERVDSSSGTGHDTSPSSEVTTFVPRTFALLPRSADPTVPARRSTARVSTVEINPGEVVPSSKDDLKKAYRREALKWHPDRHPEGAAKKAAEVRFKQISEAYQALTAGGGYGGPSQESAGGRSSASGWTPPGGAYTSTGRGGAYQRDSAGNTWRHTGTDYSRNDADRVFEEMFGKNNQFVKDFMNEFTRVHRGRPGMGGMGGMGGGPFGRRMSNAEWEDLAEQVFSKIRHAAKSAGSTSVREEIYTRADGRRVVRTTTTTSQPGGGISVSTTERIVGVGGPYDYYRTGGSGGVPHEPPGGHGGRAPPPNANSLVAQFSQAAGRLVRVAVARFAAVFTRRLIEMFMRLVIRAIFGGRR